MGEMVLNSIDNISVVDVYDIATTIGSELERIIDTHGVDSVTTLLPKVVGALELLEAMAGKNEQENILVQELNDRIAKLECDKKEKAAFRERSQKELEAIEEEWKTETNELLTLVNKLQEENSALKKTFGIKTDAIQNDTAESISRNVKQSLNIVGTSTENLNDLVVDMQLLQRQRNLLEKQRDKIKQIENKLQEQQSDNENLSIQIERLQGTNRDTKKRQKVLQLQIRTLVEERADFLAQLQDQHREIINLKKQLGVAEKENEDLTSFEHEDDPHRPRYTTAELKEIFAERDDLKTQVLELHEQLNFYKPVDLNVPDELEGIVELQKKILQSKVLYHMSPRMHRGRNRTNLESVNSSESCLLNRDQQVYLNDRYPRYLKWLCLLALILMVPYEKNRNSQPFIKAVESMDSLEQATTLWRHLDIWFLK